MGRKSVRECIQKYCNDRTHTVYSRLRNKMQNSPNKHHFKHETDVIVMCAKNRGKGQQHYSQVEESCIFLSNTHEVQY